MPNRIIKESICTSEDINRMDLFTEIFYYRLLVNCDDYGRMDARPAILRARLFPLREVSGAQVEAALAALAALGCVRAYEAGGRPYVAVVKWGEHQRLRTQRAKYPAPGGEEAAERVEQVRMDVSGPREDIAGQWCDKLRPESESESQSESEPESQAEAEAPACAPAREDAREADPLGPVAAAAADVGMPFAREDRRIAQRLAREFTPEWAAAAVRRAANGPSRSWRYVQGILRAWKRAGGIDLPERSRASPGRGVRAQQYTQRQYTAEALEALFERV